MSLCIVVLDGYTVNPGDLSWTSIDELGDLTIYDRTQPAEIVLRSADADILIVNKVRINEQVIHRLEKLKCICLLATGFDNIDIRAASRQGIAVYNAVGYGTESVAQHTLSLLLAWTNHVGAYADSVKKGDWQASTDFTYQVKPVYELKGKKLGLFGLGKIGTRVATLANAFKMEVQAYTRNTSNKKSIYFVTQEELFKTSDFLSLHVPLTDSTKYMIDKDTLRMMRSDSILVNTSRGGLVVEDDLIEALTSGVIKGAALDVITIEPPVHQNPLMRLENCIITPHMAWTSIEARRRLIQTVADNIRAFLNDEIENRVV